MTSSSSVTIDNVEPPSVSEILDMNSSRALWWCNKLGLSTATARTKKARQTALIEHLMAKRNTDSDDEDDDDEQKSIAQLPFSKEPTSFTWKFTKDELKQCDSASKKTALKSTVFTDKNGMQWLLEFYPKGDSRSTAQKAALFLTPMNWKQIGAVKVSVLNIVTHVESDFTEMMYIDFDGDNGKGLIDFMDMPTVASSQCPVCLEQVSETLTTECGHTFCAKCTVKMLTASQRIKCPLCRRTVDRNDELTTVRYAALESFTLTAKLRTGEFEKDKGANATLGDVMHMIQTLESKLSKQSTEMHESLMEAVSGLKRSFSEMNQE